MIKLHSEFTGHLVLVEIILILFSYLLHCLSLPHLPLYIGMVPLKLDVLGIIDILLSYCL